MSRPDLLSERIEEFRGWFAGYKREGLRIEPEAMIAFDALISDFVGDARTLEARAAQAAGLSARCAAAIAETTISIERAEELRLQMVSERVAAATGLPLDRVVAELDEETRATNAFTASIARTKDRIVAMRAAQGRADATEKAILDGVAAGRVTLFPIVPRPVFGAASSRGDVPVETALDFLAAITRDAPKSRFDDAPTFDAPEDCA